jgi:hypothetical protein
LRWLKILLPAVILAGMCAYSLFEGPRRVPYLSSCLRDPVAFDGRVIAATGCRVAEVQENGFIVRHFGKEAFIKGMIPGLAEGQYVDFVGRFHKQGRFELEKYHVSSRRARLIKLGVSLIPLAVVGYMLCISFRRIRTSTEMFIQ